MGKRERGKWVDTTRHALPLATLRWAAPVKLNDPQDTVEYRALAGNVLFATVRSSNAAAAFWVKVPGFALHRDKALPSAPGDEGEDSGEGISTLAKAKLIVLDAHILLGRTLREAGKKAP